MRGSGLFRRQRLLLRITLSFVATAVILALVLGLSTFYGVRSFLETQRVRSATRQTVIGLLFAREFLQAPGGDPEELVARLQTRGDFQTMVTQEDDWFATSLSLTPALVPAGLGRLVGEERLGYQLADIEHRRWLVFGAPLPPEGTDLYLFYAMGDIDETMSVLVRVVSIAGVLLVAFAALIGRRVGRRIIRPLGVVSSAAGRIAEGLLETRVTTETRDEVGLLAASFNEMAAALQEMIARERRFVSNVSHELRTPLAALRTASDVLAGNRDLPPSAAEAAALVAEDVENLQRLVEELMEVSAVDAGRATVRWEDVDVRALAEAIVRKRRLDVPVSGGTVVTVSDKARLERIIGNLLDNAVEHGDGAPVSVAVSRDGDGACVVSVSDEGPGIAAADLPHLFDRFYKADRARTRERGGIGLGLAIAFENARLLGGTLTATSEPGSGATFLLRLPLRTTPPPDAEDDA